MGYCSVVEDTTKLNVETARMESVVLDLSDGSQT
jgi:hypothetical protein